MKTLNKFIATCTLLTLVACGTAKVISDQDPTVQFDDFKTVVVCKEDLVITNTEYPDYDNIESRELLFNSVAEELQKNGYRLEDQANLQIGFKILISEETLELRNCYDEGEVDYWPNCKIETLNYTEHTIVLYATDLAKNQVVWQGSVSKNFSSPKRMQSELPMIVRMILEESPFGSLIV